MLAPPRKGRLSDKLKLSTAGASLTTVCGFGHRDRWLLWPHFGGHADRHMFCVVHSRRQGLRDKHCVKEQAMTRNGKSLRTLLIAGAAIAAFALPGEALAARGGRSHHSRRYDVHRHDDYAPIYHPPSVHTDYRYHAESYHWTPWQGLHTHGHYDAVPHYTPGHIDYHHGDHVDVDPRFHD